MFLQKFNAVYGKSEWHYVDDNCDVKNEIARSTYAGMLHDTERNMKYNLAITEAVRKTQSRGVMAKVLDIGTGTGILAMMAAKSNAESVTACEVFEPMARTAKEIIEQNGFAKEIHMVAKKSTEMNVGIGLDMEHKANILVTEIFDTELLGEGVLPTLRHAHRNLMEANSVTIPSSGSVYIQLAECFSLWKSHKLLPFQFQDGTGLRQMESSTNCQGLASAFELHIDEVDDIRMLTKALEAVRFNFNVAQDLKKHDNGCYDTYSHSIECTAAGVIHCVVFWWEIVLDESGKIILSMVPKLCAKNADEVKWRDHWMQAVYFLPEEVSINEGDTIDVTINYDDYCFWFTVQPRTCPDVGRCRLECASERPICSCGLHTIWSRERFFMNNDQLRRASFVSMFQKLKDLPHYNDLSHCLVVGDVSLMPFYAAKAFKKVTYVECGQFSKGFAQKLTKLNGLSDKICIKNMDDLEDQSLLQLLCGEEIDVIAAEPYFSSSLLPWDHFSFWFYISPLLIQMKKVPIISPGKAILKAAAVEFKELWKIRSPVKEVMGLKLEAFDVIIEDAMVPDNQDEHGYLFEAEPYPTWEYEHNLLSESKDVATFDFTHPVPVDDVIFTGHLQGTRAGRCDAFILWVDYYIDEELHWTTGLMAEENKWVRHSKQGVHIIKDPYMMNKDTDIEYHVVFQATTGKILFRFANTS